MVNRPAYVYFKNFTPLTQFQRLFGTGNCLSSLNMVFLDSLNFDRNSDTNCKKINHKSAIEYPEHVTAYLQKELDNKAMLGPFRTPPINNLHVSPFMTRDNSSSVDRGS